MSAESRLVGGTWFKKANAVIDASRTVSETQFGGEPCEAGVTGGECPYCAMDALVEALDALDEEES